jgi:hypothetical protein
MSQGIRRPIYLSPTKDADILKYVGPLEEKYSFSSIVKELMRDGIKFRARPTEKFVPLSHTSPPVNIQLKRKEVTDEELDDMLDNF